MGNYQSFVLGSLGFNSCSRYLGSNFEKNI